MPSVPEGSGSEAGSATVGGAAAPGATLRHGTPEQAGLIGAQLDRLVAAAESYLSPMTAETPSPSETHSTPAISPPRHPWYAGAVLLAGRGDTVALHRAIGTAVRYAAYDEEHDQGVELPADQWIPMTPDTVFDLASLSKLFTSVLAVQQLERGALDLGERVASYLPEFGEAGKQDITVRQLLTHTAGFRAWLPLYEEPTREARLRRLWQEAPAYPPGTKYLYSDLTMIALHLLLEKVTGRGLEALLRDEITAPLGMRRTRFNPPPSWKPSVAATEDARPPWSGLDRGLVWGEVHDENAWALGGVAGHAGVFSRAWDLAVLARTLLNGGVHGRARILDRESVELMFTDFNTRFPGDAHGLGIELYQHWYMGAMATPRSAGHTGFTGTSLVLDPTTDTFLVMLGNSVHPVRTWRSGSAPRLAAANHLARAVAVPPSCGRTAWFSGMSPATTATLTLPRLSPAGAGPTHLGCALWWDTEPASGKVFLEASADEGATWRPLPFTTVCEGQPPLAHPGGWVAGWSGRVWHRVDCELPSWRGGSLTVRWRSTTGGPCVGRGVYVTAMRVTDGRRTLFDESRPSDAACVSASGWTAETG
ncbi:serine hydrolase [Streptomyces sp. NPDC127084]|uniref:serine hydrolase n=1 Tax=Streptomyces sp. NPDC127084 TaxID=3347133 RepID=UPI00365248F1